MTRAGRAKDNLITWGRAASPFGRVVLALTGKGVCLLSFGGNTSEELAWVKKKFPGCVFVCNTKMVKVLAEKVFNPGTKRGEIELDLRGTDFQRKVWKALQRIPFGETVSYEQVAIAAGNRKAVRAAAGAVANNPVAYLVPCHRVIKKNGDIHNYAAGKKRKKAMLLWESREKKKIRRFWKITGLKTIKGQDTITK